MKIALYGKPFNKDFNETIEMLFKYFITNDINVCIYEPLLDFIKEELDFEPEVETVFTNHNEITSDINFMISIGGDGTILETVTYVRDKNIPIIGINTGRLGFLANISKEEVKGAIKKIFSGKYTVDERTLLQLHNVDNLFGSFPFALNELTIHKNDTSSMITIHAYLNDVYLNSYWADGLIISTPTGSTAYSMSAGGPIIVPNSNNFVITPIAPHNLTIRPIVVSDDQKISLKIEGRSINYLASLDSRSELFETSHSLVLSKADFKIKLIRLENQDYFETLRNKLMWGVDKRN
ncbi:MAG: NAD kinase [Marinilabiliales bacterium]